MVKHFPRMFKILRSFPKPEGKKRPNLDSNLRVKMMNFIFLVLIPCWGWCVQVNAGACRSLGTLHLSGYSQDVVREQCGCWGPIS